MDYLPEVRAVLNALRKPSAAMMAAGLDSQRFENDPDDVWIAMIDAMLGEDTSS